VDEMLVFYTRTGERLVIITMMMIGFLIQD